MTDHTRGDGPVELLEFGDFECPYCAAAVPGVEGALREVGDHVTFRFRHLPLDKHPHARRAAEAAEAAGAQGAFWPMHDRLFAHREALADDDLVEHARALGLDAERFADDLRSGRFADAVRADAEEARARGATGTPAFFVAGERHTGFYDAETLADAIRDASEAARPPGA